MSDFQHIGISDFSGTEQDVGGLVQDGVFHASSVPVNLPLEVHTFTLLDDGTPSDIVLNGAANYAILNLNLEDNPLADVQMTVWARYGAGTHYTDWRPIQPTTLDNLGRLPSLSAEYNPGEFRIRFSGVGDAAPGYFLFPIAGATGFRVVMAGSADATDLTLTEIVAVPPIIQTYTRIISPIEDAFGFVDNLAAAPYADGECMGGTFHASFANNTPLSHMTRIKEIRGSDYGAGPAIGDFDLVLYTPSAYSYYNDLADGDPFSVSDVGLVCGVVKFRDSPAADDEYPIVLYPGATGIRCYASNLDILIPGAWAEPLSGIMQRVVAAVINRNGSYSPATGDLGFTFFCEI